MEISMERARIGLTNARARLGLMEAKLWTSPASVDSTQFRFVWPLSSDRSGWPSGRLTSVPANDRLRGSRTFRKQVRKSEFSLEATFKFPASALQRLPWVAAGSWVHGTWHEAVIRLSGSAAASMTGNEGSTVIQRDRLQVAPPTRGRVSAAQRAELTPSTAVNGVACQKVSTRVAPPQQPLRASTLVPVLTTRCARTSISTTPSTGSTGPSSGSPDRC